RNAPRRAPARRRGRGSDRRPTSRGAWRAAARMPRSAGSGTRRRTTRRRGTAARLASAPSRSFAGPRGQRAGLPCAPPLLALGPVGRTRLVGKTGDRLVEELAQLLAVLGVREDVEAVPPDRAQHLLADLVRVHAGLVQAGQDAHEVVVGRR